MKSALPIPPRLLRRPRARELPVPYIALLGADGSADFRVIDERKRREVAHSRLCQLCGEKLGVFLFFACGPDAAFQRIIFEPPMHLDCMVYAMQICPFIVGKVEHAVVETVARQTLERHGVLVAPDPTYSPVRDPHWIITKAAKYELLPGNGSLYFRPEPVLYTTPPVFPETMTAADWLAMETLLRAA